MTLNDVAAACGPHMVNMWIQTKMETFIKQKGRADDIRSVITLTKSAMTTSIDEDRIFNGMLQNKNNSELILPNFNNP